MKYFLPDCQDFVDPRFDFEAETHREGHRRHVDDHYAHETFAGRAYDGLLVSKAIVDGTAGAGGRYTGEQRRALLERGVHGFLRASNRRWGRIECMGDCGAFSYVDEDAPPYSVADVLAFYHQCGFDYGLSVDHIIREYAPGWESSLPGCGDSAPPKVRARQEITLELAREFFARHTRERLRFVPIGVAHGWGPRSYAAAVAALQAIGFRYVALGGLVALRTDDILACLEAVAPVRRPETRLHLLGVARSGHRRRFAALGVASFDSTSPLRQAFMADRDNYHSPERAFTAIRVPQALRSPRVVARIRSGEIDEFRARTLERRCLDNLAEFAAGRRRLAPVLSALRAYECVHAPDGDRGEAYREALEVAPWRRCPCEICRRLGHHVLIFRGAERNRSRGFHNVWVFHRRLRGELDG